MNALCPYCSEQINASEGLPFVCESCKTPHHAECWAENCGCTVFGCTSSPADELPVSIDTPDLASSLPPPVQFAAHIAAPPPPPPQGQQFTLGGYVPPAPPPPLLNFYPSGAIMPPGSCSQRQKSRITFILLGIFFGAFGAHNFYAGYTGRALGQLCLTLCSFFMLSLATVVWALVDICVVDHDARHLPMI